MKKETTATQMINASRAKTNPELRDPKVGDSVHIGFITDGNGKRIKKGALTPFDKIVAVYSDKETGKDGNPLYNVQVSSGDLVKVANTGKSAWEAVV